MGSVGLSQWSGLAGEHLGCLWLGVWSCSLQTCFSRTVEAAGLAAPTWIDFVCTQGHSEWLGVTPEGKSPISVEWSHVGETFISCSVMFVL